MALKNRKLGQKKNDYYLNNQTIDDKQDANANDTFSKLVTAGLVTAGGIALYKSGALRPVMAGMKKFGANFAEFSSSQGYHRTKVIKDWANGNTREFIRPDRSLFNPKKSASLGYDLWQDLKESVSRGELYSNNVKRIINDTVEDINILNQMIQKETKGFTKVELDNIRKDVTARLEGQSQEIIDKTVNDEIAAAIAAGNRRIKARNASITKSAFIKNFYALNDIMQDFERQDLQLSGNSVSADIMKRFMRKMSLDEKTAEYQLKHTGYRTLTFGDIFESFDVKERKLNFKKGFDEKTLFDTYKINFGETINSRNKTVKQVIEDFLADSDYKYESNGKVGTIGLFDEDWKRLIIDPSLNINKNGDIINYMMGHDALAFFGNSLRKDFKLPVIGFNPIDSAIKVTPFDNYLNDKSLSFAIKNGVGGYDPFITGHGSRSGDDINTFLQKKFNKPDETFHVLFADGDLYALGTKGTKEYLGGGFKAYDITKADKVFKMPHDVEIMRQMGNYNLNKDVREDIPFADLTFGQKIKKKLGDILDIGHQEFRASTENNYEDIGDSLNPDNTFDSFLDRITHSNAFRTDNFQYANYEEAAVNIRDKTYNATFGKGFDDFITDAGYKIKGKNIVFMKEGIGINNLIDDARAKDTDQFIDDLKGMFGQFFSGFSKTGETGKYLNTNSSKIYDIFNALDSGLSHIGLGLSLESKRSTGALLGNLLLRRALPVYMLSQIPGMINYFSEPLFTNKKEKEEGKTDTLGKTLMRNVVKPIDLSVHGIGDKLGFTKIFKYLQEMTPGSEQFNELPLIYQLGLGQTKEEREEYIEKGYDPVRKNRYWSVSNTPFTGSKIDHWRPNIYRRIEADVKYSDTMYGSRKEYYQHTWYPNLVSPFAPIRHFITDPHHWDKKHYNDRPYAETAPKGENIPLIGPLISGTIGQVYRKKMHQEYWNPDGTLKAVNPEDEKPSQLLMTGTSSNIYQSTGFLNDLKKTVERAFVDTDTFNKVNTRTQEQYHKAANQRLSDIFKAMSVVDAGSLPQEGNTFSQYKKTPLYDNALKSYTVAYNNGQADVMHQMPYSELDKFKQRLFTKAKEYASPLQTSTLPYRDYNQYDTALDVYTTPSGGVSVVDVPENLNLYKVNEEIKHYSLNKIYGTNQRVDINEYDRGYEERDPKLTDNQLMYSIGKEFNDIANIYGLKGFLIQTMFTGEANVGATQVETSSYTYSANRSFWDQNLGGLGGELSEISRRFIHKKDKNTEYLNPIRNTMPTWMPGSNYFTDYLHGDPYSKIMNGEERLPGEGYERLNNIDFSFNISASMIGNSRSAHVKHFLHQDTNLTYADEQAVKDLKQDSRPQEIINDQYDIQNLNQVEEFVSRILDHFREADVLIDSKFKFKDEQHDITGVVDARIKDYHSRTGESLINIRGVGHDEFKKLQQGHNIRNQDYYEMNYDLYALKNTQGRGYVYYYDKDNPDDIYKARVKFNRKDLRSSIQNLNDARGDIYNGLRSGEISRGDLYSLIEKYKILADTAPYSQEFKDISAQISHAHLSEAEKQEVAAARERMKAQKEPLRTYNYKFKTSNLKSEEVTVKRIIDNNTFITEEYGKEHSIKFAGINVSESNSTLYKPTVKEKKEINKETGRERTIRTGKTMNQAANDEINKYLKAGQKITIQYDADERNKYNKDSTQSIRAIVNAKGVNVNRKLLNKGLAKEKENDESPAGIHARYSKGDIAFGSMMETLTHSAAKLPFIGDKFFQIRSPYEQYRKREVYNKDFKSWNHPIRDFIIPTHEDLSSKNPVAAVVAGAFLGSMCGKQPYGKMIGAIFGGTMAGIGTTVYHVTSNKDHEWRPKRRRQQEEINTYIDTLKYVKNTRLYNQYKELAKKKDKFDVDAYLEKQAAHGEENKLRQQELNNYKRLVKLDFKHRGNYNFKYGEPKYEEKDQSKKEVIRAINRELAEISNDRKVEKLPLNAIKAISYKQAAERTMYGYDPGDDVRNIMAALPKKERQYYSKLVEAPEEEKDKILRIAPNYLRRALQASWGMHVDEKPELTEYFKTHALPDENWSGWDETTNLEDVKVKMVNSNGLDPGEFDIWTDNKKRADETNIPIPRLRVHNDPRAVQAQLTKIFNSAGLNNVQVSYMNGISGDQSYIDIKQDSRAEIDNQIKNLNF